MIEEFLPKTVIHANKDNVLTHIWTGEQANTILQMSKRNRERASTVSPIVARVVFIWIPSLWLS